MMCDIDYLVLGLGGMGSAALYQLARSGVEPVGIEQYERAHDQGSSHGASRAFRVFYHDAIYASLAEASIPLWRELEEDAGEVLLHLCGLLAYAKPDNSAFARNLSVLQQRQTPHERLTAPEVSQRFPALCLPEGSTACYVPQSGFVDPTRTVHAHLRGAEKMGAEVKERVRIDCIDLDAKFPVIETSEETYRTKRLVLAPGPWAPRILQSLSLPLKVTRQEWFNFVPQTPDRYVPDRLPAYADFDTKFYGFPLYGAAMKVADDTFGDDTAPDTMERVPRVENRAVLLRWLQLLMPDTDFRYDDGKTCMYTLTADEDFLIGPHPKNSNVFVAAGFSGHGFKFCTLVGKILADLAVTGKTDCPIARFRLDRFH